MDQSKTVQQVVARGWGNLKAWAPVMKIQHLHSWKFFSPSHSCWCKYTEHCLKWCFPQSKRRQQSFFCCFLVGVVKAYLIFIFFLHSRNLRPRNFTLESAYICDESCFSTKLLVKSNTLCKILTVCKTSHKV